MSGHTPGPWKLVDVIGQCTLWAGSRQLLKYTSPDAENLANANLIAAAPDLLEALESLTADRLFYYEGDTDAQMNVTVAAYENARAAIARAKGEK